MGSFNVSDRPYHFQLVNVEELQLQNKFHSLERLLAVNFPINYRCKISQYHVHIAVSSIWLLTVPFIVMIGALRYHDGLEEGFFCIKTERASGIILMCCGFILSVIYISITYKIFHGTKFLHATRHAKSSSTGKRRRRSYRKRVERQSSITALCLSLGFLIFTLPTAILLVLPHETRTLALVVVSESLLLCNSIFNPIVYFWRGHWLDKAEKRKSRTYAQEWRASSFEDHSRYNGQSLNDLSTNRHKKY